MNRTTKLLIGRRRGSCRGDRRPASRTPSPKAATTASRAITGDALAHASQAALAHTGGGRVTDTEVGDEESYYEVEVTLDDGSQLDVQLDESFHVVGGETDGAGEDDGPGDD